MNVIVFLIGAYTLFWIITEGGGLLLIFLILSIAALYFVLAWATSRNKDVVAAIDHIENMAPTAHLKRKPASKRRSSKLAPQKTLRPLTVKPDVNFGSVPHNRDFDNSLDAINRAISNLSRDIREQSGSLFYTGRTAFSKPSPLYVLGLNPGGDPFEQENETVERAIDAFVNGPANWSAYLDDSWQGAVPGTRGIQPRVLHFFEGLGLDPRSVPASNVIFVRSTTESTLAADKADLIALCWPIHEAVINQLDIKTIACFGSTAGRWVREQLGASSQVGEFREANARGWKSQAHQNADGLVVLTLSHPGRADWRNPVADPTPFVKSFLERNLRS